MELICVCKVALGSEPAEPWTTAALPGTTQPLGSVCWVDRCVSVLTLVGWMSGSGSRDSGIRTTSISFLAFHSFLNRSILAAASSLMDDPGLWFGPVRQQKQA